MERVTETEWIDSAEYLEAVERVMDARGLKPFQKPGYRYAWTNTDRFDGYIEAVLRHTTLEGKRILDSGCGAGGLCLRLLRHRPAQVVGFEMDEAGALAESRAQKTSGRIKILRQLSELDQLPDGAFDVIFSLHVIEHVDDVKRYLSTLHRLLAPKGVLCLACPDRTAFVEPHSSVPLLHYFPPRVAVPLSRALLRAPLLSDDYRTAVAYFPNVRLLFSPTLRRKVRAAGFRILEHNNPRALPGKIARRSALLGKVAERLPAQVIDAAAMWLSSDINLVCERS